MPESKLYEVKSIKRGKFIYVSAKNNLSSRNNSSVAAICYDQDTLNVGFIQQFIQVASCNCSDPCSCETHVYVIVKLAERIASFPTLIPGIKVPNTHEYKLTDKLKLFPCTHLVGACILMDVNDKYYISLPLNSKERE